MDDLDSLLNDLSGGLSNPPAAAAPKTDLDELDDLLNNIGAVAPAPTPAPAPKPNPAPAPASAPAADADLDALMESLGSVTPAAAAAPATGLGQDDLSELDALMASTLGPAETSTGGVTADELNELNALMGSVGSGAVASGGGDGLDDLDALMQSLDVQAKKPSPAATPVKAAPAPAPAKVTPAAGKVAVPAAFGAAKAAPVSPTPAAAKGPAAVAPVAAAPKTTPSAAAVPVTGIPKAAATPTAAIPGVNPMMGMQGMGGMGMQGMAGQGMGGVGMQGMGMNPMMGGMGMQGMQGMGGMGGMGMGMNPMMGGMNPMMGGMNPMMGGMNPMMGGGMGMQGMQGMQGMGGMGMGMNPMLGAAGRGGAMPGAPKPGNDISNLLSNLNESMGSLDSGTVSRGICATCTKPILGEVIQAMGKTFHPEHFICGGCQTPLGTRNFFDSNGLPFCETCYQLSFCPRCASCNEPILNQCVAALGLKWHVEHFVCNSCSKPFPGGNFFEKESRPYCEECFLGSFAPKCAVCNQLIKGDCVNALQKQWHPQCFTCAYCKQPFSGTFFEKNGRPYCDKHYLLADTQPGASTGGAGGGMCKGCLSPITGAFTEGLGARWHPEHFLCGFCMTPLKTGAFKESSGKAFCPGCAAKFGIL